MDDEQDPNLRLLALTDGVIAITITLLVLELRLPEGFGGMGDGELWSALVSLWPRFLAYLLSFAVIGSFWLSHRGKFEHIVGSDPGLLWINMLFLLTMSIVPFTTNLIAESGGTLATAIYAGTMALSGLSLTWLWIHAHRRGLLDGRVTGEDHRRHTLTTLVVSAIFGISIPLSIAHADVAKYFWLLIIPVNFLMRLLAMRRWKRQHPGEPYPDRRTH